MKKHLGSTVAIVLGILVFAGGIKPPGDGLVVGPMLILGALAYRSCKKRKLAEVPNTWLRFILEIAVIAIIPLAVVLQNDLKERLILNPIMNFITPMTILLAYGFISLRKSPPVASELIIAEEKKTLIISAALLLISLSIIAAFAYYIYGVSPDGTAYLIGEVIGAGAILITILWFAVKRISELLRVSLGILLATLFMAFHNWNKMEMAIDVRSAQRLIAETKGPEELSRLITENPTNYFLKNLGTILANANATRNQIAELTGKAEPEELINQMNKPVDTMTEPELGKYVRSLRLAQKNATEASNAIPEIYDNEMSRTAEALNSGTGKELAVETISGVKKRHDRERPFLIKTFRVSAEFYDALANQAELLLSLQGSYTKAGDTLQFVEGSSVEKWNELLRLYRGKLTALEALETERIELDKVQAKGWAEIKEQ